MRVAQQANSKSFVLVQERVDTPLIRVKLERVTKNP